MTLTKKDKEEIAKIVKQVLANSQTTQGEVISTNGLIETLSKLEELDKKWREEGIVSETTGLIIAPEDVEVNGETEFTWDEAMALEKEGKLPEGWRLPTRHEWVLIAEEFGQDENGTLRSGVLGPKLNLKKDEDEDYYGNYWSSAARDSSNAYNLYYASSSVNPQSNGGKDFGRNVRCVKEKGEDNEQR